MPPELLEQFSESLNQQQLQAVTHGQSPLLIVAGAGTGKTTTLAHRVAWMVAEGIPPERILLLTFSRRAASELLRRVTSILMDLDPETIANPALVERASLKRIQGGTFHSVATNILRRHGSLIGLNPDFTILDRGDSEDLLNLARSNMDLPTGPKGKKNSKKRFPLKGTCIDIYSRCVNTQMHLDGVLVKHYPWCLPFKDQLAELFTAYSELKEQQRVLDFDDLLLFWNALLQDETGGELIRERYDRILVDEYQDTNVLQSTLLNHLCADGHGLTAVGDDAQSIYSFRAATVKNILEFPSTFPGTQVIPLEQNYRSVQRILDVTNAVIGESKQRHRKELWSDRGDGQRPVLATCGDEESQTEYIIDTILAQREKGVPLNAQAVLFRSSHHSMNLEAALGAQQIPFRKFGGLRFLETAHIKDALSFLRLTENPFDAVAGLRVLVLLPGIGPAKAQALLERLVEGGGHFDVWQDFKVPAASKEIWPGFLKLLKQLVASGRDSDVGVGSQLHAVNVFYMPLLETSRDAVRSRKADLQQLEVMASRYPTRQKFLAEMTLDPPSSTADLSQQADADDECLTLSTIHSAKGLEWDTVFVLQCVDGSLPAEQATQNDDDIEEERRLFYVALTRAKNSLHACRPERGSFQNRWRGGGGVFTKLTRFLPNHIQERFEKVVYGDVLGDLLASPEELDNIGDTSEVRNRVNRLWG